MTVRSDRVFVSSVLFALSLLALVPHSLAYTSMWPRLASEGGIRPQAYYLVRIGSASLAIVFVGLIVIWTGYTRRQLWSWFVMFVIVWVFTFPAYTLPMLLVAYRSPEPIEWSGWLRAAASGPGVERDTTKALLDFLVMLVALFVPVKSFFGKASSAHKIQPPSPSRG